MVITLPEKRGGECVTIDTAGKPIVIVGANGAGKSRFTTQLKRTLGDAAYELSALDGLYVNDGRPFNDLLDKLMHDEMINLLNYKIRRSQDNDVRLERTRLDTVIELWQEIFPDNKILIESGQLLFSRGDDTTEYGAPRLSDGEKAVIYYLAGALYAPTGAVVFVSSPEMFLHPTIMQSFWTRIELMRSDCSFVYTTHDLEFTSSRTGASVIWVRDCDSAGAVWNYTLLGDSKQLSEDVYQAIIGARKPVLFIEGDGINSIDSKLYPLVFSEFTVKSLGSCNKVIEATRTFNDLKAFHHMDSYGIVDRDRRDSHEVDYLRGKKIMVPEVAEIENILMLEDVIKAVAHSQGRKPEVAFTKVSNAVIGQFAMALKQQALQHTRHRVKRTVEYRIDRRFTGIEMLEEHIKHLHTEIEPRRIYEEFCREFRHYVGTHDYSAVLKVYNQKSMLASSNVASLCGLAGKEEYVQTVINLLGDMSNKDGQRIRRAVKACFGL